MEQGQMNINAINYSQNDDIIQQIDSLLIQLIIENIALSTQHNITLNSSLYFIQLFLLNIKPNMIHNFLSFLSFLCFVLFQIQLNAASTEALVVKSYFTNYFTDNDFGPWTITAVTLPSTHLFTECDANRIFGGYQIFGGDPTQPVKLQRVFTGLIGHYSINIQAKIYKIDSWNNEQLFVMVDNQTVIQYQWNSTTGSTNLCGDPNPVINGINSNYNDSIITLNINVTHTSANLNLTFATSLKSLFGWWGIREIQINLNLCDKSCKTCTSPSACITCETTIPGLILVGAYCSCTSAGTINQKTSFCPIMPCITCVGSCSPGYYLASECLACNAACSSCAGPANNPAQCTACAVGYFRFNPATDPCFNCFSTCSACTDLTSTGCTSCNYGYFFLNNECLSQCPTGYYSQQSTSGCSPCLNPCATCDGATNQYCLTCVTNYYVLNKQCYLTCPSPYFGFNGVCYDECPITTFTDNTLMSCDPCSANCDQCLNATACTTCATAFYLYNSACQNPCPPSYYEDSTTNQCVSCDPSCSNCNGSSQTNCLLCSNPSYFLVSGSCLVSCPNSTYSVLCLPCDSSCLQCFGGLYNQCTSCKQPEFLNLNTSVCLTVCSPGSIIDKANFQCWSCALGLVSNFQICVNCNSACQSCYGTGLLECSTCKAGSNLVVHTCQLQQEKGIIPSSLSSYNLPTGIYFIGATTVGIGIILEFILTYKSPLLPLIQLLQILAYQYYFSIQMSQTVQNILVKFYYLHFSSLINFDVQTVSLLPDKLVMMQKTGYYALDTLTIHLFLIIAGILFLLLRKIQKIAKIFETVYSKLNPYLLTYLYRLLILQQSLALILFVSYGQVSTTIGVISMIFLIIDILIVGFALFWKIKTQKDSTQYALFYFNQIGQHQDDYQIYKKSLKSQKKVKKIISLKERITSGSVLPSLLFYVGKIPFAFIVVLLIQQPQIQVIGFFAYSLFFTGVSFLVPYRRRIYKYLQLMLCLCVTTSSGILLGSISSPELCKFVQIVWLIFITLIFLVCLFQILINFRFWINYYKRAKLAIIQFLTKQISQKQSSQASESQQQSQEQISQNSKEKDKKQIQKQQINGQQMNKNSFNKQMLNQLINNEQISLDLAQKLNFVQNQSGNNEVQVNTGTNRINSNQYQTNQRVEKYQSSESGNKMIENDQKALKQKNKQKKVKVSLDFDL